MANAIHIRTGRLVLRPFELEDAPFALELLNEPAFRRFIGDKGVRDLEGARRYLEEGPIGMVREHGHGLLHVALRSIDEPLGMCGLLSREGFDEVDLGFAFLARHRRRGYCLEAAREVLEHARRELGVERVVAYADPDNEASAGLLARLGLLPAGRVELGPNGPENVLFAPEHAGRADSAGGSRNPIHVRRMHPEEGPALLALFKDTVRRVNARDYDPEQIAAWAYERIDVAAWCARFDGRAVFVAEDGDRDRAGFADLRPDGHLNRFFVSADHQGLGTGRALMAAVLDEARALGLERLCSEVSLTARGFFERQGFVVVAPQTVSIRGVDFRNFRMERRLVP